MREVSKNSEHRSLLKTFFPKKMITISFLFIFASYIAITFYLPEVGFLNARDGLLNMEYAKYQLANGFALDGFWSYTLNGYHPTPFYHLILIFGGFGGNFLTGNFDAGAQALLITVELALLFYATLKFSTLFKEKKYIIISFLLIDFMVMTPLRKDHFRFAEPELNYVNINLNFVTLSVVIAWLLAFPLILRGFKGQYITFLIFSASLTGYMPLMLAGLPVVFFIITKNLLSINLKSKSKITLNKISKNDRKHLFWFTASGLLPYLLILVRIILNGVSSIFPKERITNVSGLPTTLELFEQALSFHLYNIPLIFFYFFLLVLLLTFGFRLRRVKKGFQEFDKASLKITFVLIISLLALLLFIYLTHPSPLTLYMSTFISFIAFYSLIIWFYLIIEKTIKSIRVTIFSLLLISTFALALFHGIQGGFGVLGRSSASEIFAYRENEILEFNKYLIAQDININNRYEVYYNHDDYNLTMIAPVLLKWMRVNNYNVCIRDEKSLPSFNCDEKNRVRLQFVTDRKGFKSKHLDVFNPVKVDFLPDELYQQLYSFPWKGSWPTIKDVKIFK